MWLNFIKKKKKIFKQWQSCQIEISEFIFPHFLDMINIVPQPATAQQRSRYYGWPAEKSKDFVSDSHATEALLSSLQENRFIFLSHSFLTYKMGVEWFK